jgi:hypothetical protein
MRKLLLGSAIALLGMFFAAPAMANPTPSMGWLELCKNSDQTAPVSGPFTFQVSDGSYNSTQTVTTGTCTSPFQVPVGTATVKEDNVPYATVTAISALPSGNLVPGSVHLGPGGSAQFTITGGDESTTTTAEFTNKEVTGYIEICKQAVPGSGLTGSFQFAISGAMGFNQNVTVPVGACSDSIQVPAGSVIAQENPGSSTYVVSITSTAGFTTLPMGWTSNPDLLGARASVPVAAGDTSAETILTFTNSPSVLKLCKAVTDKSLLGVNYPFTVNGSPISVPAALAPNATCEIVPGIFTAGTRVNIAEGVVPGTQVQSIVVTPSGREVAGANNPTARTDSVILGSGETIVTYTNEPAPPGTLKICKIAGLGVAPLSMWSFTVAGVTGTINVPAGLCAEVPTTFPFNSTQTITETPTPGYAVTAIAALPANRLASANPAGGTGSVTIGSGVTQILFTNALNFFSGVGGSGGGTGGGTGTTGTTGSTHSTGTSVSVGSAASSGATAHAHIKSTRLIERNGRHYLVVVVDGPNAQAHLRLSELTKNGKLIRRTMLVVETGTTQTVRIPFSSAVHTIRLVVVS